MILDRRQFLAGAVGLIATSIAGAQEETRGTVSGPMNQDAYLPVKLPPKSGTRAALTIQQRDDLEHKLQCQCGCTLDVFTCRTTDFSCSVSPAMHVDVMGLISGGYNADEILAAFRRVYGERVLLSPVKEGFNWVGYTLPFVAIGTGSVALFALLKRWSRPAAAPMTNRIDATPEELARLREALRTDE